MPELFWHFFMRLNHICKYNTAFFDGMGFIFKEWLGKNKNLGIRN